jgi:hypothetical protein
MHPLDSGQSKTCAGSVLGPKVKHKTVVINEYVCVVGAVGFGEGGMNWGTSDGGLRIQWVRGIKTPEI